MMQEKYQYKYTITANGIDRDGFLIFMPNDYFWHEGVKTNAKNCMNCVGKDTFEIYSLEPLTNAQILDKVRAFYDGKTKALLQAITELNNEEHNFFSSLLKSI